MMKRWIVCGMLLSVTAFAGCKTADGGVKDRLCTVAPVACKHYKVIKEIAKGTKRVVKDAAEAGYEEPSSE